MRALRRRQQAKPKVSPEIGRAKNDDGPELYCICQQPYDSRRFMIGCDHCDGWFHARCVNITVAEAERLVHFICPPCKAKRKRKDNKDRKKKKTISASRAAAAVSNMQYRAPSRNPSRRIKRVEFRRAQDSNHAPYEPNFDTSGSEEAEDAEISVPLADDSDSEASAELGFSAKDSTLTVDVHSYKVCHEDLGAGLHLDGLMAQERDKLLLTHLNRRAFEIECELDRTNSRNQIKASGIAFAKRETLRRKMEARLKEIEEQGEPDYTDTQSCDGLVRGINSVRALREVKEHNMKCFMCKAYIPVIYFSAHLAECSMLTVLKKQETLNDRASEKPFRKRKRAEACYPCGDFGAKYEVCGCPLVDPSSESPLFPKSGLPKKAPESEPKPEPKPEPESEPEPKGVEENAMAIDEKAKADTEKTDAAAQNEAAAKTAENAPSTDSKAAQEDAPAKPAESAEVVAAAAVKNEAPATNGEVITTSTVAMAEVKRTTRSQAALSEIVDETLLADATKGAVNGDYKGYCGKLRSECAQHVGWVALWEAEIAQQTYFHKRRLALVREEIAAVKRASEERKQEIDQAKRKTETADVERRADDQQLGGGGNRNARSIPISNVQNELDGVGGDGAGQMMAYSRPEHNPEPLRGGQQPRNPPGQPMQQVHMGQWNENQG